jgi:hypothetical protein
MITENRHPVPPPTGAAEARAVDRIWSAVQAETNHRWPQLRTRRTRIGAASIAAVLLFGGGVAVGGATLAPLTNQAPAFTVSCYPSQSATTTSVKLAYSTEQDAAVARANPVGACAHIQTLTNVENGIDALVRQQLAQGHSCGAIHLTDGTMWSFIDDPKSGLTIESATPVTPLGADCVQLQNVQAPAEASPQQFACTVDEQRVDVYPGDPKNAGHLCAAKGLTVDK